MNKVSELGPILTNYHSSMKELKKNQQTALPSPAPKTSLVYSHSTYLLQEARTSRIQAPARLRDFALCWMFFSLASTGFLEHLTMPTDSTLPTKHTTRNSVHWVPKAGIGTG